MLTFLCMLYGDVSTSLQYPSGRGWVQPVGLWAPPLLQLARWGWPGAVVQESCYCGALEAALMGAWRWNKGTYISCADSGLCEGLYGKHLSGISLSEQQAHESAGLTPDVTVRS